MLMNVNLLFTIWANNFQLMNEYLIMREKIRRFSLIFTTEFPVAAVSGAFKATAVAELGEAFSRVCMSLISCWITRVCIFRFFANKTSMFAAKTPLDSWKFDNLNCELEMLMLTSFKICALQNLVATPAIMLIKMLLAQH